MLVLLLTGAVLIAQGEADERLRRSMEAGEFLAAWEQAESAPDPTLGSRWRSEVLYMAGDPAGALEVAQAGLRAAPDDLELSFRAAASALWLQDARAALEHVERLERVLGRHATLDGEDLEEWQAACASFRGQVLALVRHNEARARAEASARAISLCAGGVVLALLWLGRRLQSQGKSSSPVS